MKIKENKYVIFDHEKEINFKYICLAVLAKLLGYVYKFLLFIFPLKKRNSKKHQVSICAIFKNESKYLKEWIEFHRIVGVQHFYLYNNNSDDEFLSILEPYIKNGIVDLVEWKKNHAQMEAYRHCITNFAKESQWIGFIDLDEFVVPIVNDSIYDYLSKFNFKRGAILIYWKLFGSSGYLSRSDDSLVTETFRNCWHKYDAVGKCFYNTNFSFLLNEKKNSCLHHLLWTKYLGISLPPFNVYNQPILCDYHFGDNRRVPIQINHYFTKTYEEYLKKSSKGDVYFQINPHDEAYFYRHEMKCTDYDYCINKYMVKLKLALHKQNSNSKEMF